MSEITVTIKGEDSTYKQEFIIYEEFTWSEDDPTIKACIQEALDKSKIEPIDIKVRGLIQIK
jgi:hypothetical protein